jgi:regulator of RNase E activity RraB
MEKTYSQLVDEHLELQDGSDPDRLFRINNELARRAVEVLGEYETEDSSL